MKYTPILFSTPMVQAILEGKKTITRRIIKTDANVIQWMPIVLNGYGGFCDEHGKPVKCKYNLGDVLWVRETFGELYDTCDHDELPGCPQERWSLGYVYKADGYQHTPAKQAFFTGFKPSIHMPKEACRLFLKISDIRVERLQDITGEDALNEGVTVKSMWPTAIGDAYIEFENLWKSINGDGSWDSNPWVWVIEFEQIGKPENFK